MKDILASVRKIKGKKNCRNAWLSVSCFLCLRWVPTNCLQVERNRRRNTVKEQILLFSVVLGEKKKMQPGLDSHENFIALLNSAVSSTYSLLLNISGILRKVFNCTIVYLPLAF